LAEIIRKIISAAFDFDARKSVTLVVPNSGISGDRLKLDIGRNIFSATFAVT